MDGEIVQNIESGRSVFVRPFEFDKQEMYSIYGKDKKLIGTAWVGIEANYEEKNPKYAYWLLDINIYDEKNRRQGAAGEIIELMQYRYPKLITGVSTNAGRNLCLKHGFKIIKGMSKKSHDFLFWERSEPCQQSKKVL